MRGHCPVKAANSRAVLPAASLGTSSNVLGGDHRRPEGPPNVQVRNVLGCVKGSLASLASGAALDAPCARCVVLAVAMGGRMPPAGLRAPDRCTDQKFPGPWSPVKPVELVPFLAVGNRADAAIPHRYEGQPCRHSSPHQLPSAQRLIRPSDSPSGAVVDASARRLLGPILTRASFPLPEAGRRDWSSHRSTL